MADSMTPDLAPTTAAPTPVEPAARAASAQSDAAAEQTTSAPKGRVSAIEAAFEKASQRLAARQASPEAQGGAAPSTVQAEDSAGHAAVTDGASTQTAETADATAATPAPETPSGPAEDASRAPVPENLPDGLRSFLQGLPPEQRQHHLEHLSQVTKGVQAFLQRHAEQRKDARVLDEALAGSGFTPGQVAGFIRDLQSDPAATLRALAEQYQVELDTELKRPEHFETIAEYDAWRDKKDQLRFERYARQRERAEYEARARAAYEDAHAQLASQPGYDRAQIDALVRDSNGFLTPQQAYGLTQVEALRREVHSLRTAKAEAERLRQEAEQRQKAALGQVNGTRTGRQRPGERQPATSAAAGALDRVLRQRGMA